MQYSGNIFRLRELVIDFWCYRFRLEIRLVTYIGINNNILSKQFKPVDIFILITTRPPKYRIRITYYSVKQSSALF